VVFTVFLKLRKTVKTPEQGNMALEESWIWLVQGFKGLSFHGGSKP
jgi:hypothetical protein